MKSNFVFPRTALLIAFALFTAYSAPLSAQSHKSPAFRARTSTKLNFGPLEVGRNAEKTFYYENTGKDTLIVYALDLSSDSGFTVQFASLKVAPGGTGKVRIQFAPAAPRLYTTRISFVLADGLTVAPLELNGTGTSRVDNVKPTLEETEQKSARQSQAGPGRKA